MDSVTQAVLGAAVGEAVLGKHIGNKAAIAGAIIATIPDLDVLLTFFFTPLQNISIHRGYSHSILFCILFSLLLAWWMKRRTWSDHVPALRLYAFVFLTLCTHVLLDAFTTYGTQLFLPFTDYRVSFDSINIVDPFYTIPLLIGVVASLVVARKSHIRRSMPNTIGLIFSSAYLLFTLGNKQGVEAAYEQALKAQGIVAEKILTVPVKVGNMYWYGVGKTADSLYIGRYSRLDSKGIVFNAFPINDYLLDGVNPELAERLKWFAQGYYVVAESEGKIRVYNMQCDMQGVRHYGDYLAPTAFYFQILPLRNKDFELSVGMHPAE
jgi:inner membrane protein